MLNSSTHNPYCASEFDDVSGIPNEAEQILEHSFCSFCDEISGDRNLLRAIFGFEFSRLLTQTRHSLVIPSLGQFVEGYLLALPKRHVQSWALLTKHEFHDLEMLIDFAEQLVRQVYGHCTIFEHGTDPFGNQRNCGMTHAHVHLVPGQVDLCDVISELNWCRIGTFEDIIPYASTGYLMIKNQDGMFVSSVVHHESQLLRRMLAKALKCEVHWNWRTYVGRKELLRSVERYTKAIQQ